MEDFYHEMKHRAPEVGARDDNAFRPDERPTSLAPDIHHAKEPGNLRRMAGGSEGGRGNSH